ncbi:MAG: glycosyltransferase family 2 protein [Oscillospiraceae bacterium]|nr:glycosyltransferase family 2 protein [Oscillospiraceae bacterium]
MKPLVSIVIPVYNVEKYIDQCLQSAINQTMEAIEIICIDDGSTDRSGEILDRYAEKDARIKVIHQKNGGYGKAMNAGLREAKGEFFCILESDDFLLEDSCELLYKAAIKYDAEIVRADYYDFSTTNKKTNLRLRQITQDYSYYNRVIVPNEEREVYAFVMHNWTGIYKLSFLRENGISYHETPGAAYQDNGFYFQAFSRAKRLVYIPKAFYCYRIDNEGSSIHDKGKVYAMTKEYDYIRSILEPDEDIWNKISGVFYNRLFRACVQTYRRIDATHKKEYQGYMKDLFSKLYKQGRMDVALLRTEEIDSLFLLINRPVSFKFYNSSNKKVRRIYESLYILVHHGVNELETLIQRT